MGGLQTYFSALFFVSTAIWAIFKYISDASNERTRAAVKDYLYSSKDGIGKDDWAINVYMLFEGLYGERQWSWVCLRNSLITSSIFVSTAVFFIDVYSVGPFTYLDYFIQNPLPAINYFIGNVMGVAAFALAMNGLADFFSLWESRLLFEKVSEVKGKRMLFFILLADFVLSGVIYLLCVSSSIYIFSILTGGESPNYFPDTPSEIMFEPRGDFNATFWVFSSLIASAYISSFLSWLYLLSLYFSKIRFLPHQKLLTFLSKFFDFNNKPIESFGLYIVILLWVAGIFMLPFYTILSW